MPVSAAAGASAAVAEALRACFPQLRLILLADIRHGRRHRLLGLRGPKTQFVDKVDIARLDFLAL